MRKLIVLAALASLAAAPALAATTTAKGDIKSLDAKACTVTLSDNFAYQFGKNCNFSKLKLGEKIAIVWTLKNNVRQAVQVFVAT